MSSRRWTSWESWVGPSGGARSRTCRVARSVHCPPLKHQWSNTSCLQEARLCHAFPGAILQASCNPWSLPFFSSIIDRCVCMGASDCFATDEPAFWTEQTSLRELTTLGIKNAENLAIPSVRNDVSAVPTIQNWHVVLLLAEAKRDGFTEFFGTTAASSRDKYLVLFRMWSCILFGLIMQAAFLFTVVGTTGFLAVLAGQLPGVLLFSIHDTCYMYFQIIWAIEHRGLQVMEYLQNWLWLSKWKGSKCLNLLKLSVTGLGLLCSLFDRKHFIDRIGCR